MSLVPGPHRFEFEFYVAKLELDDEGNIGRHFCGSTIGPGLNHRVTVDAYPGDVFEILSSTHLEQRAPIFALVTADLRLNEIGYAENSDDAARVLRYLQIGSKVWHDSRFGPRVKITVEELATVLGMNVMLDDSPIRQEHFNTLHDAWRECIHGGDIAAFDAALHHIVDRILQEKEQELAHRNRWH